MGMGNFGGRRGLAVRDYVAGREGDFGVLDAGADAYRAFVDILGWFSGMNWMILGRVLGDSQDRNQHHDQSHADNPAPLPTKIASPACPTRIHSFPLETPPYPTQ